MRCADCSTADGISCVVPHTGGLLAASVGGRLGSRLLTADRERQWSCVAESDRAVMARRLGVARREKSMRKKPGDGLDNSLYTQWCSMIE